MTREAHPQAGCDGAVVMRLIEAKRETVYIPGTTSYWGAGGGYAPYRSSPGQYVDNTVIRAEVSVYTVPDGKMLWAGASATTNPANAKDVATQVARAAAEELRKQGLIP